MKPNALCVFLSAIALAACNASGDAGLAPAAGPAAQVPAEAMALPQYSEAPALAQLAAAELSEVLRLEIMHDYFADGRCSACRVTPSADTATVLRRANAAFRAEAGGAIIAAPSANLLGDRLTFEVDASDPVLASVTAPGAPELSPEVADVSFPQPQSGAWAVVAVAADADAPLPVVATVTFSSREARWRWIVLPGDEVESLAGWTVRRESAPGVPVDYDPAEATGLQDGRARTAARSACPPPRRTAFARLRRVT